MENFLPTQKNQSQVMQPSMGCQLAGRGGGAALRGGFILLMIPVGIYALWKRKRK